MKRDWEVIRNILIAIEADCTTEDLAKLHTDWQLIATHLRLLKEADLVDGIAIYRGIGSRDVAVNAAVPPSLTWAGYDFLDAIRDETVWEKAKGQAAKTGGAVTLAVLTQLATYYLMEKLGMKP
jgi:hypothetical protein